MGNKETKNNEVKEVFIRYKEEKDGSFKNFKCDICQSQMKVDKIMSTEVSYDPFTDALGNHFHDGNNTSASLICENKHTKRVQFHHICPNPKCDWVQSDSN